MYRSTAVALNFGNLGYIITIISSLSFAMQPRSKFIQSLFRHLVFTLIGVAVSLLGLWSARQAKNHTQSPNNPAIYNPNAAAVCAVFLFFNVFAANAFRSVPAHLVVADSSDIQI